MSDTDERNDVTEAEDLQKPTPPLPPPPGEESHATVPDRPATPAPVPGLVQPPVKSPPLAAFLSVLFPGLGYLYTWAYERAFIIWAAVAFSIFLIVQGWWGFAFVAFFIWMFSIFDSYREAQIAAFGEQRDEPPIRSSASFRMMFGVFLAVMAAVVLIEKLDLFDVDWLFEWWPVPVFLVGLYFIGAAIWERISPSRRSPPTADDEY